MVLYQRIYILHLLIKRQVGIYTYSKTKSVDTKIGSCNSFQIDHSINFLTGVRDLFVKFQSFHSLIRSHREEREHIKNVQLLAKEIAEHLTVSLPLGN